MEVPTKEEINQEHLAETIDNLYSDKDSEGRKF